MVLQKKRKKGLFEPSSTDVKRLKRELWILRILCLLGAMLFFLSKTDNFWYNFIASYFEEKNVYNVDGRAPFSKEIEKIVRPLRYSGLKRLLRPEVRVSIDFKSKKWTLHDIHHYDEKGRVVLEEGRYGICQELAAYTYEQIRPLLKDQYDVFFLPVSEAGFFPYPGTHTGICITKQGIFNDKVYFLDPAYHRYGELGSFDEYYVKGPPLRSLSLQTEHNRDVTREINIVTPLVIRQNYLIGLSVESAGDLFDKDNFIMAIVAMRKYRYNGRFIFAFKRVQARTYAIEDESLGHFLLKDDEYRSLREKCRKMYMSVIEGPWVKNENNHFQQDKE